jgi:hypothetical protein
MRGIIVGGVVVPGTDFVQRIAGKWWNAGDFGTRSKLPKITKLVGHWTAGEAGGVKNVDGHGDRVFDVLKTRTKADGSPLACGITFVIGAPKDPNDDAQIWQFMDPATTAGIHVGSGVVNGGSIGVEIVSAGSPGSLDVRKRERVTLDLLGGTVEALRFYPGQIRSWVKLANVFGGKNLGHGIEIARKVPSLNGTVPMTSRRFTATEAQNWSGAAEHFLVPGTTKVDAAGLLIGALAADGWALEKP